MRVYSYVINGVECLTGRVLKINRYGTIKDVYFQWYIPEKETFCVLVDGGRWLLPKEMFLEMLVEVTDRYDVNKSCLHETLPKKWSLETELSIDGMLIAWIWYIFIMLILVIYNDRVVGWIAASIWFFSYRNEKLRKYGYKK